MVTGSGELKREDFQLDCFRVMSLANDWWFWICFELFFSYSVV